MKKFFVQNLLGEVTVSNCPIKENGVKSKIFEITEEQLNAVQEGTHDFEIVEGQLTLKQSQRKAKLDADRLEITRKKEEAENLKNKLSKGSASLEEIQIALSKLL